MTELGRERYGGGAGKTAAMVRTQIEGGGMPRVGGAGLCTRWELDRAEGWCERRSCPGLRAGEVQGSVWLCRGSMRRETALPLLCGVETDGCWIQGRTAEVRGLRLGTSSKIRA